MRGTAQTRATSAVKWAFAILAAMESTIIIKIRGRFLAKTKAGNHNSWYEEYSSEYDIVAQIDTDFQVRPDFLTRTLGYFRNPQVAFVGTPQVYGNMSNFIARGAAQQTYLFYGPIMRALSHRKMALLIGANHVIRVAALRDVGGYQGHLTEDLATGVRFHAGRWESVYVPEVLAVGEGPTSWSSYFNQQYRWAYGCMNIFFTQTLRLNFRMRPNHAVYYFLLQQFYFSGFAMVIAVLLLMLYYLFGWVPANFEVRQLVLWYLPLLAWRQVMLLWLQRFNVRPREERGMMWVGRILTIAAIPIYFLALAGVLSSRRATWKTTPKGSAADGDDDGLGVFMPHITLLLVIIGGLGVGIVLRHTAAVFLAWGSVTAGAMSAFVLAWIYRQDFACTAMATVKTRCARQGGLVYSRVSRPNSRFSWPWIALASVLLLLVVTVGHRVHVVRAHAEHSGQVEESMVR